MKNEEADRLLRELTELTGESLTDAITLSLRERLVRERRIRCLRAGDPLTQAIEHLRSLAVIDRRSDDEILGYDHHGLPT